MLRKLIMPKIKILSQSEARKIAAGEVVERPANIVKELIENSIDAGAKNISIYLTDGGKKLIKIIDDGCGMSIEDARLCFEHHATSKISNVDDLYNLSTFGFRGEALSSISSVAKVKLVTKEKNSLVGTNLVLEDGLIIDEKTVAATDGTEFEISNLFYNIPARLKFLKKSETELRSAVQIFQAFCLSYTNIHFKFYHDDKLVYNCPATNSLISRLVQLWDHNFAQNMIDLQISDDTIKLNISGIISNHQFFRFNRNQIFFFVNGRWIKNQNLSKALFKGYLNVLPKDRFPAAFIFISTAQDLIDVNIHPRKEEVQFLYSKKIENLLQDTVKQTLENNLSRQVQSIMPANEISKPFVGATTTTFDFEQQPFFEPEDKFPNIPVLPNQIYKQENYNFEVSNQSLIQTLNETKTESQEFISSSVSNKELVQKKEYEIVGQFNKTYILLQKEEGLFLVDQHAAHERVLYEIFEKKFNEVATIKLIFPDMIKLTQQELNTLSPYLNLLRQHGIEADCFSQDQLVIYSTPVYIKDISFNDLIRQLISWIEENQTIDEDELSKLLTEKLRAQMACKAAVKAGDELTLEQMKQLLTDLDKTENRFACPHGRPTGWLLSIDEIEKKFKRKL